MGYGVAQMRESAIKMNDLFCMRTEFTHPSPMKTDFTIESKTSVCACMLCRVQWMLLTSAQVPRHAVYFLPVTHT